MSTWYHVVIFVKHIISTWKTQLDSPHGDFSPKEKYTNFLLTSIKPQLKHYYFYKHGNYSSFSSEYHPKFTKKLIRTVWENVSNIQGTTQIQKSTPFSIQQKLKCAVSFRFNINRCEITHNNCQFTDTSKISKNDQSICKFDLMISEIAVLPNKLTIMPDQFKC